METISNLEKIVRDAYECLENVNWYGFKIAKEIGTDKLRWYQITSDNEININVRDGILEDLYTIHKGDNPNRIIHKEVFQMYEMLNKLDEENWSEKPYLEEGGMYCIKNMYGNKYELKDAYDYELKQSLENIEVFTSDLQEEILECKFDTVKNKYLIAINNAKLDKEWTKQVEEHNEYSDKNDFIYDKFITDSIIKELQKDGWNTDYIENTISYCRLCGKTEIYGLVVRNEDVSSLEPDDMPL